MTPTRTDASIGRRALILGTGTLLGGGLALGMADDASANTSIQMGTLGVDGGSHSSVDPTVVPVVDLDVNWSFEHIDGADMVHAYLEVAPSGQEPEIVDWKTADVTGPSDSGSTVLSRATTQSGYWTAADWQPASDETISREVQIRVRISIEDADGNELESDSVGTTKTISVTNEPEPVVEVGAVGSIEWAEA